MNPTFQHIALIGKHHTIGHSPSSTPHTAAILKSLADFLRQQGCQVTIEQETAKHAGFQDLATLDVPLIGINQGRLGFITDIALDQIEATLQPMLHGAYEEDHRVLMHGQVWRGTECVFDALALNDVVVNRGATSGMVELRVSVDGHFVANQRADGLIIATPTGSTAYALSAGGPMLQPSLAGLVMVPIAPHTLSNRPLVLADPAEIVIELVAGRDASANFDMQSLSSLLIGDQVKVRKSPHHAVFLHPRGWSYFDTLRQKLHWNEGGS
jgi:NAD+ kinase